MNKTQLNQAKKIINDLDFKNAEMIDLANLIKRVIDAVDDIRMGLNIDNTITGKQLLDAVNQISFLVNIAEERRDNMQTLLNGLWDIVTQGGAR